MPDEKKNKLVVPLQYPIPIIRGGEETELKELVFPRRLKTKHLRKLPDSFYEKGGENLNIDELVPIIAKLSGHSEKIIDEVDADDLISVAEKLNDFFGDSLPPVETGKETSGQ